MRQRKERKKGIRKEKKRGNYKTRREENKGWKRNIYEEAERPKKKKQRNLKERIFFRK